MLADERERLAYGCVARDDIHIRARRDDLADRLLVERENLVDEPALVLANRALLSCGEHYQP